MEKILCAAIWYNNEKELTHAPYGIVRGYVMCGHRHHQIIELYFELTGNKTTKFGCLQGFLTDENRFVTRETAAIIALESGQIKEKKRLLHSEDLY